MKVAISRIVFYSRQKGIRIYNQDMKYTAGKKYRWNLNPNSNLKPFGPPRLSMNYTNWYFSQEEEFNATSALIEWFISTEALKVYCCLWLTRLKTFFTFMTTSRSFGRERSNIWKILNKYLFLLFVSCCLFFHPAKYITNQIVTTLHFFFYPNWNSTKQLSRLALVLECLCLSVLLVSSWLKAKFDCV